jgi:hypothetical protein
MEQATACPFVDHRQLATEVATYRVCPADETRPPCSSPLAGECHIPAESAWHVLITERSKEGIAVAGLIGRRFEVYSPTFRKSVRGAYNTRKLVRRPLFPCYAFVLLPTEPSVLHRRARDVPGVVDFLKLEPNKRATISVQAIQQIRSKEPAWRGPP